MLRRFSLAYGGNISGYAGLFGNPSTYGLMYNISMEPHPVYNTIPVSLMFTNQLMSASFGPVIIVGAVSDRYGRAEYYKPIIRILLIRCPAFCPGLTSPRCSCSSAYGTFSSIVPSSICLGCHPESSGVGECWTMQVWMFHVWMNVARRAGSRIHEA